MKITKSKWEELLDRQVTEKDVTLLNEKIKEFNFSNEEDLLEEVEEFSVFFDDIRDYRHFMFTDIESADGMINMVVRAYLRNPNETLVAKDLLYDDRILELEDGRFLFFYNL